LKKVRVVGTSLPQQTQNGVIGVHRIEGTQEGVHVVGGEDLVLPVLAGTERDARGDRLPGTVGSTER
jgi:hypothetical protein